MGMGRSTEFGEGVMEQFYILIVLSLGSTISTIRPGGIFLDLPINQSLKSLFPASDTVVSFLVRPNGNSVPWLSGHSLSLPYSDSSSFLEHADFVVVGNLSQSVCIWGWYRYLVTQCCRICCLFFCFALPVAPFLQGAQKLYHHHLSKIPPVSLEKKIVV